MVSKEKEQLWKAQQIINLEDAIVIQNDFEKNSENGTNEEIHKLVKDLNNNILNDTYIFLYYQKRYGTEFISLGIDRRHEGKGIEHFTTDFSLSDRFGNSDNMIIVLKVLKTWLPFFKIEHYKIKERANIKDMIDKSIGKTDKWDECPKCHGVG